MRRSRQHRLARHRPRWVPLLDDHESITLAKVAMMAALGIAFAALPAVGAGAAAKVPLPAGDSSATNKTSPADTAIVAATGAGVATAAPAPRPAGESSATSQTSPADRAATLLRQQQALATPKAQSATPQAQSAAVSPAVVTIGFDDGRETQANAGAILANYGFAGTFYLISGGGGSTFGLDNPGFLTQAQAHALASEGHEIGGHTRSHPQLTTLATAGQTTEICGGRQDLINDGLGTPVSFAYPYGSYDTSAMGVARSCGYTSARSVDNGLDAIPPAVPMAVNAFESVTSAPNRYVSVSDLQAWVQSAENSSNQKWANLYWHDVVDAQHPGWGEDGLGDAAPGYEQSVADFQTFLGWLQGEVSAGRVKVETAGQAMASAPTPPPAIQPYGAIGGLWNAKGGSASFLGAPLNNEYDVAGLAGARMEDFAGGKIYWSPGTGAHEVHGAILGKYLEWGGPAGYGLPVTDETTTPDGVGRFNHFDGGRSIYWTPGTGAHTVYGAIRAKWQGLGWERSTLGYPATDEGDGLAGARYNHFQAGSIYWSPSIGAHEVHGAIRDTWAALGWEHGALGLPTSDEFAITGGRQSDFQGGYITWTPTGGAVVH
jgi:peptidoglycan/xylan/chitin deacetylase (PgdA/CDA1 family)